MPPPGTRPILLDSTRAKLARLAQGVDGRATGHRRALASRLASPPLDAPLTAATSWPSAHCLADSLPRSGDSDREPVVGRAEDSRRTAHAWHVSERTVSRLLKPNTLPSPQTWKTFLTNHLASAASMDFFTVPTLTGRVLFVVIVLSHIRRRIVSTSRSIQQPSGPPNK